MYTKSFWKDLTERAIKTGLQAVLLFWGLDATGVVNALHLDWAGAGGVFLGGVVLSGITSIVSAPFGNGGTASVTSAVEEAPGRHAA